MVRLLMNCCRACNTQTITPTVYSRDAVYPFSLPSYKPIDEQRILTKYMKTSRYEIIDIFRRGHSHLKLALDWSPLRHGLSRLSPTADQIRDPLCPLRCRPVYQCQQ